ncbi:Uncharacterised protein [Yersinia aldovae]|nr:Uncharacterised protein [Yersinia aldovae]
MMTMFMRANSLVIQIHSTVAISQCFINTLYERLLG